MRPLTPPRIAASNAGGKGALHSGELTAQALDAEKELLFLARDLGNFVVHFLGPLRTF